ncbi:hypothetical protein RDI58_001022 [Solanum bulbocastanum]|uniref:Uncharacterized protein n=1 Tax=Solanum bulbocastanum TaxID=147425 RepID=A0AAN8U8R0_SOLBU
MLNPAHADFLLQISTHWSLNSLHFLFQKSCLISFLIISFSGDLLTIPSCGDSDFEQHFWLIYRSKADLVSVFIAVQWALV